ncbi:MAG: hypothetical protein GF353_27025 [Candidatus Lokiarchaeota archaeon]|nr:hypothetical protein [Candidatus Lokiarchaeota archaeon]
MMMEVDKEDKLFFFEKNFFTLDGLWMIETENETDWDKALIIDSKVWMRLLEIIVRRIRRYLGIKTKTLKDLVEILTFRWSVEGWNYHIIKNEKEEMAIEIMSCPYKEAMDRNPERQDKIPLICKDMCISLYDHIVNHFNSNIRIIREKFQGLSDSVCTFIFKAKSRDAISKKRYIPRIINNEDKLFYFEKNFFTLDGLWIIEIENELNWSKALEIDIIVWQRLYKIIFRRLIKYLKIKERTLKDLIKILTFSWSCEGYEYEIINLKEDNALLQMTHCPYMAAMERNPERHEKMEAICKEMCIPFFLPAIREFNPRIKLERSKFIGAGDKICDFKFKALKE